MNIELPDTQTQVITRRLRELREERGEVMTGRVLTFIVVASAEDDLDDIIATTHDATREHPARVVILVSHREHPESRLDAEIRMGGDAGASETIVMHLFGDLSAHRASVVTPLLLPDTPVVAYWPRTAPRNLAADPIGALATRRISDSFKDDGDDCLFRRRMTYERGDSDLVWARITLWRALLASVLDQPPHEAIDSIELTGPSADPAVDLAAGWLAERLDVPVRRLISDADRIPKDSEGKPMLAIQKAVLHRESATIEIIPQNSSTVLVRNGEKESLVTLGRRSRSDCLTEELRHLDPDYAFGHALRGLKRVSRPDAQGRTAYRHGHVHSTGEGNTDRWSSRPDYRSEESNR